MEFDLVVVRPFGAYAIGNVIQDDQTIRVILTGEHAGHVVRVTSGAVALPDTHNPEA
jgi:hypothetical protein